MKVVLPPGVERFDIDAYLKGPPTPIETIQTEVVCAPSDTTIANLARAYGAAYAAWVRARRETPNDIVETTMDYVAAERALRVAVNPKTLTEEEALP